MVKQLHRVDFFSVYKDIGKSIKTIAMHFKELFKLIYKERNLQVRFSLWWCQIYVDVHLKEKHNILDRAGTDDACRHLHTLTEGSFLVC